MRYGCLKMTMCNEAYCRVGIHGSTWNRGKTRDFATWNSSKSKLKSNWVFRKKSVITFCTQFCFLWINVLLVPYGCRELYKKLELEIISNGYVRGCPKWPVTQIWSLRISKVKLNLLCTRKKILFNIYTLEIMMYKS